jgi:predicted MPP superfamily phosphohydrolase
MQVRLRSKMQRSLAQFMRQIGRYRFDPTDFEVTQHEVYVPHLDVAFEGYRLVHVSDIHMGHWITKERLAGVVELVNAQQPELVAITGDFVSYELDEIAGDLVDSLSQLTPRDVTVAVLGNHDHWLGAADVRRLLAVSNVIDVSNDVYTLRRQDAMLHIAGVDDVMVGADHLPGVLDKLPETGTAVLLAHEPDFADVSAASGRFALQLSGHSHGSQIVLPIRGPLVRGPHFRKYPIGRYEVEGMTL